MPNLDAATTAERLQAKIAALEELLEVQEICVAEQSVYLQNAQLKLAEERDKSQRRTALLELAMSIAEKANAATTVDEAVEFALNKICVHFAWSAGHAEWLVPETRAPVMQKQICYGATEVSGRPRAATLSAIVGNKQVIQLDFFSLNKTEIQTDHESVFRYIGVQLAQLVERKWAESDLISARDEAEQASRSKSDFLAVMSHEIRTPMNGVLGMTALALDTELNTKQRDYLNDANESAEALLRIINDILDFSKMAAGELVLVSERFSLNECIEQAGKAIAVLIGQKDLHLKVKIDARVPPIVIGDASRLRQVLLNLLSNAIKFTERGEIVLSVKPALDGTNKDALQFSIRDTGVGIAPDKLESIFNPFKQADSSISRRYGGTGLGLTISQRIVSLFKGSIWVESILGTGSTFHFVVVFERYNQTPADKLPIAATGQGVAGAVRQLNILLVDDNRINLLVAKALLDKEQHRVTAVSSGQSAIQLVQERNFDLVLMDVQMPEMDGVEATARIRSWQQSSGKRFPIVALTAHAMKGDRARCLASGMDDYLAKPIRIDEFRRVLSETIAVRMLAVEASAVEPISAS